MSMGKMSRRKGANGEREIVKLLQKTLDILYHNRNVKPPFLERNQMQTNRGGYDIIGVDWIAIEIKRCEILEIDKWWIQCLDQAKKGQEPVLIHRKNHAKWRVRMMGTLGMDMGKYSQTTIVDTSIESFLLYFESRCAQELSI